MSGRWLLCLQALAEVYFCLTSLQSEGLPYLVNMRRTDQPLHALITKKVFDLEELRCINVSVASVLEFDQSPDTRLCLQWLQEAAKSS